MDKISNDRAAFYIFPEELWELVMEKVDNSEDIRSLIRAFPELGDLSQGKQFSLLIGDLMPLIMSKFLTKSDILSCSLVSKRWRNGIESSLVTHPDHFPYKSTPSAQMAMQLFNYSQAPRIATNLCGLMESGWGNTELDPVTKNPFLGRNAFVKVSIPYRNGFAFIDLVEALPVVQAFGHHLWYFTVDFFVDRKVIEKSFLDSGLMPLLQCLSFMPNLRSLQIRVWDPLLGFKKQAGKKLTTDAQVASFPFLLETLDLTNFSEVPEHVYSTVIKTFGSFEGIQKLKLDARNWIQSYAIHFPNLTEISVKARTENELHVFLNGLLNPHLLQKLDLNFDSLNICKLLEMLEDSPLQVESLEIWANAIVDCPWKRTTLITTIQGLKIKAGPGLYNLKFEFLKALPELKYLTVWDLASYVPVCYKASNWNTLRPTAKAVFRFVLRDRKDWINFEGVWEELRKLEMLTAIDKFGFRYQYIREFKGKVFQTFSRICDDECH